ncbi:MAG: HAMP domain-containing histidine kinase [Actinomycetota bacterium]|nr:HAMP domain-containing histidine kinase [Actinomycetota bacterium]
MSLRGRLLLAAAAMVALALLVADLATYAQLRSYLFGQVDRDLNSAQVTIADAINHDHFPGVLLSGLIQVRNSDDDIICCTGLNQPSVSLPAHITLKPNRHLPDDPTFFNAPSADPGVGRYRVRASALASGGQLIVALPLDQVGKTLHHQARVDLAVTAFALIGVVVLGLWLVRLSLRPLQEMEDAAGAIAEGEFGRRVPGDTDATEVGRLARTLNVMLTRIQEAFAARDATERQLRQSEERLRRFVADASHELRTPVAAVGAYAELFERGAANRPEDLARVLAGIRSETVRMGELVEDLLLLARLDEGRPLEQQPVELVGLVAEAVGAAGAVGPDWPVRLQANHTVEVTGDAARLRQVVDNLLANVRSHTPRGTATVVRVGERDGSGVIEVSDDGPGLPSVDSGRVFERFYRADPSRSRQFGGAGLGLAIVAAIVAAHGGTVAATATPGGGATLTVWLPTVPGPAMPGPAMPGHGGGSGGNGAATSAPPAVASEQ